MINIMQPTHREREPEHEGPIWKHPYFAYILVSMGIFILLVGAAALALKNGWLPNSGN